MAGSILRSVSLNRDLDASTGIGGRASKSAGKTFADFTEASVGRATFAQWAQSWPGSSVPSLQCPEGDASCAVG